jgi:FtsH-binding integral membrane protein
MNPQENPRSWSPAHTPGAEVAALAPAADRAAFITRTYIHLLGAILAFTGLEVLWFSTGVAQRMFELLSQSRFVWLVVLAAFVGVGYLAERWARSSTSVGMQYAGLALFTTAESLLFLPLIGMALMVGAQGESGVLSKAVIITLLMFGSLTGVVFVTRKDFSFMRGILIFGSLCGIGFIIASIVFGFSLGMAFSYVMIALACGYILYDTSNVLHHYRTTQHVAAALALFASVMLLFWYVLRILVDRRR